jgi:hypothetical protein
MTRGIRAIFDRGINNSTSHCTTKQCSRIIPLAADFVVTTFQFVIHNFKTFEIRLLVGGVKDR